VHKPVLKTTSWGVTPAGTPALGTYVGRSDAGTVLSRLDYSPSGRPGDVNAAFRRGAVGATATAARAEAEAEAQALFYHDLAVRSAQVIPPPPPEPPHRAGRACSGV
jgi:hypothetical protein